ncbi:hypothetical protein [Gymnodinialimonas sp.]
MSFTPHSPARAIALAPTTAQPPRTRFFPQGPGPSLIVFAMLIGVAPSLFAQAFVVSRGIDGGYYMPAEFIRDQRHTLLFIGLVVGLAAAVALGFTLHSLRTAPKARGARIVIACVLVGTIAWDWMFFASLRGMVTKELTYWEVERIADIPYPQTETGLQGFDYDGQTFRIQIGVAEVPEDAVPMQHYGPLLCVRLGGLFAGPVQTIGVAFNGPEGAQSVLDVPRADCRTWYMYGRRPENRPRDPASIPRLDVRPLVLSK